MKFEASWPGDRRFNVDISARLAELADEGGDFDASAAVWMEPIIHAALRVNEWASKLASQLKTHPPLLTPAEKRQFGINPRLKVGRPFAECLTEAGRADPGAVATMIADAFLSDMNEALHDSLKDGTPAWNLFVNFLARHQRCPPHEVRMIEGDPTDAIALLWFWMEPMQEARKAPGAAATLRRLGYDPSGEAEFDLMLERIAVADGGSFSMNSNAGISVWTERVTQAIMSLKVNAEAGLPAVLPPMDMDPTFRKIAIGLLWLYRMQLPFPVTPAEKVANDPQPLSPPTARRGSNHADKLLWVAIGLVILLLLALR